MLGNPKWFKRRKYTGWGMTPVTKEGWAYILVFILGTFFLSFLLERSSLSQIYKTLTLCSYIGFFSLDALDIARKLDLDEREEKHEALAERNAAWVMVGVLCLGIIFQTFQSALEGSFTVDPFLLLALFAGVVAKATSNFYLRDK